MNRRRNFYADVTVFSVDDFNTSKSGSIYTRNDRYTPMEFSRMYLDKMFTEIMGFDAFYMVRVQGTQTQGVDISQAVKAGHAELTVAFLEFY